MNDSPKTWKEWEKKYQGVIKHSPFEWDFAKDVIPQVPDLKPSQVTPQYAFTNLDGYECHMDFAIIVDNLKIAIELEGYDKTNSGKGQTREKHADSARRQQALTRAGWKLLSITNSQFKADPMYYANMIRQMVIDGLSLYSESVNVTLDPPPVNKPNKQQLFIVSAIVLGLLAVVTLLLTRPSGDETPVVKYPNCAALKKDYPGGIARSAADKERKTYSDPTVNKSIYEKNSNLDRNTEGPDGVICDSK